MLTLAGTELLAGIAGTDAVIAYTITGAEVTDGAPSYSVLAQGLLQDAAAAIYTAPASPAATLVKTLHLANTTGSIVSGVTIYVNGTGAGNQITGSFSIPANGWATMDQDGWRVYNSSGAVVTVGEPGETGPAGPGPTVGSFDADVDGSEDTFTLPSTPDSGATLLLILNGQALSRNNGVDSTYDFTLTADTVVFETPPPNGSALRYWYW